MPQLHFAFLLQSGPSRLLHLSTIDLLIIILYFAMVLGIGLYLKSYTKTGEDFFLAGREMTAWVAGLSFLGLGPEPTSPEWGRMVAVGIDYFDQWWTWLFPGLAIATLVVAFNFIGDGLRDILDPRQR